MEKVFISYSHKDEEWKDRLMSHLRTLEQQGDIVIWDDRNIGTGEDWYPQIKNEMEKAAVAICLISADYLSSNFINKEEIPDLKLRRNRDGMLLLPILVCPCPWKTVQWLKGIQMFPRDGKSLSEIRGKVNQEKALSKIVEHVYEKINDPEFKLAAPATKWAAPEKEDIDRLPETGVELFGRKKELQLLDEMWDSGSANVISFVAWGGVGKSTLVSQWLNYMKAENYRGAKKVFCWSFYSQGTSERVTSADKFISEALKWFEDEDPTKGSPWDKGQRLADLVRKEKTLLILDGLEPLQSGYDYEKGKIKDPALSILVTQLARSNNGLCVITTHEKVAELERFDNSTIQLNLDQISKEAGRALLRVGGVQGTDSELEAASEEFGNHALAINLLGSYIHGIEGHHISNAKNIQDLDIPVEKGRHPRRVIAAFEERFGEGPEIQVLCLMGLFDRPAHVDAVKAVRKGPKISGLTDKIKNLTEGKWLNLLDELRGCKLLARKSEHNPDIVDCHPLVREHFGEKLQKEKPEAWKEVHSRLYDYYKALPEKLYGKELPDKLEEIEPLFAAVTHGCLAGRYQEVYNKVFDERIHRGERHYIIRRFGAIGADMALLGCFFKKRWKGLVPGMNIKSKARILSQTGYDMLALGRLSDAAEFFKAALDNSMELVNSLKEEDMSRAGVLAGHLSRVYFLLGNLSESRRFGDAGVLYMSESEDKFNRVINLFTLADTLHQAGEQEEAKKLFEEADQIQKGIEFGPRYYRSPRGYRYDCFFLEMREYEKVLDRAEKRLKIAEQVDDAVRISAEHRLIGMAMTLKIIQGDKISFNKVTNHLDSGVEGMRSAGRQDDIAASLLARAQFYRVSKQWEKAQHDIDEAYEIVIRYKMRLFQANCYLDYAHLYLAWKQLDLARENYKKAKVLVEEMGYHRRDPELLLIQAELELVEGKKEQVKETLSKVKKRIDDMGCHRWDGEVERLENSV